MCHGMAGARLGSGNSESIDGVSRGGGTGGAGVGGGRRGGGGKGGGGDGDGGSGGGGDGRGGTTGGADGGGGVQSVADAICTRLGDSRTRSTKGMYSPFCLGHTDPLESAR